MTSFYTNVRRVGNSILVRGYENSVPFDRKIEYQPHLFVPLKDGGESEYHVFKTKTPVRKKDFESISAFDDFVETYKDVPNFQMFGCSNIIRQFLTSYFPGEIKWSFDLAKVWFFDIETCANHGFPEASVADQEMLLITMIEKTEQKMYVWTRRPISPDNEIFKTFKSVEVRLFENEREFLIDFSMFMRTTRIDILTGWNSESFDIPYIVNRIKRVLGDNFVKLLSPWKIVKSRVVKPDNFDPYETYDIGGITHLDALDLYKKFNPGSQESFALDNIAYVELGKRKVAIPVETFKESYQPEHWEQFVLYCCIDTYLVYEIDYKMQHTSLAMQLGFMAKCPFIDVISAMRLWESIIYNYFHERNIVEEFLKPRNHKEKIVGAYVLEPVPGKYGTTFSIDAAQLYPSMMMQHNISPETLLRMIDGVSIDRIMAGEISDEFDPETECLSANGLVTTKSFRGFIPELVDMMGNLRKSAKKEMLRINQQIEDLKALNSDSTEIAILDNMAKGLDVKQKGLKVASNSLYGATALPYFRYYDPRLAEAITSTGQVMLKTCMNVINTTLNKIAKTSGIDYVLAADTDSNYVLIEPILNMLLKSKNLEKTAENIVDVVEAFVQKGIQPLLDKKFDVLLSKLGAYEKQIFFKLENIGTSILITGKKRYAFDILYSEGVRYKEPKIKVTGLEIVRSTTPKMVRGYLKEALTICMRGTESEVQSYISGIKSKFRTHEYQDISFSSSGNGLSTYSSNSSIYAKGTPIHVRGALLHNHHLNRLGLKEKYSLINEGEKLKFVALKLPNPIMENVISFIGKIPIEMDLVKYVDKDIQYQKAFLKPITGILDVIGWEPEHRLTFD